VEAQTVRQFGDRYYREQGVGNRKNPTQLERYLEREIYPAFGDKLLKDVTALDVQALVYRKRDNGREAAAIMIRQVIKLLFDYAIHEQAATINPATMVATRYIGRARERSRTMSAKEIRLYLRTIYESNMRASSS
jgi:site-specific recombinase XerD